MIEKKLTSDKTTIDEVRQKDLFKGKYYNATGRRKESVAQVRLYGGKGKIIVNNKTSLEYFNSDILLENLLAPLKLTGTVNKFDISVVVKGGGKSGQSEAIRHGISRALLKFNKDLRPTLKKEGFLTRDPREKERKKYGLKRARKAPQYSKR